MALPSADHPRGCQPLHSPQQQHSSAVPHPPDTPGWDSSEGSDESSCEITESKRGHGLHEGDPGLSCQIAEAWGPGILELGIS